MEIITISGFPHRVKAMAVRHDNGDLEIEDPFSGEMEKLDFIDSLDAYLVPRRLLESEAACTATEAAEILGVSVQRVCRMCSDGLLASITLPARRYIDAQSIIDYMEVRA